MRRVPKATCRPQRPGLGVAYCPPLRSRPAPLGEKPEGEYLYLWPELGAKALS